MAIADQLLEGVTVEVQPAGLPSFTLDLSEEYSSPPGPAMKLLRPRFTFRRNGAAIAVVEPAGRPEDGLPLGLMVIALLALIIFALNR